MSASDLLTVYATQRPLLTELGEAMRAWLSRETRGLGVQVVDVRVKDRESLARKLARPDRSYRRLDDVTDVLGLRVVTLFEDQVERVARLLERTLRIDWTHSADKRALKDPSQFGYRSLHYVCRAPTEWDVMPAVKDWPFEIQVRSVLQHAWAEVEHDLGYKTEAQVPVQVRRRFARLAGLLELADAEFLMLRREMDAYSEEVRSADVLASEQVGLDARSLEALLSHAWVQALDRELADRLERPLSDEAFYPEFLLKLLPASGLDRPRKVLERLATFSASLGPFSSAYFRFARAHADFEVQTLQDLQRGYALHLLAHWEAATGSGAPALRLQRLTEVFLATDHPGDAEAARKKAQALLACVAPEN